MRKVTKLYLILLMIVAVLNVAYIKVEATEINNTDSENHIYLGSCLHPFSGYILYSNKNELYDDIVIRLNLQGVYISKSDIISVKSSDNSIMKISSKYKVKAMDAGAGYFEIKIKETQAYKACSVRMAFVVYSSTPGGYTYGPQNIINKKNGKKIKNTFVFAKGTSEMEGYVGKKTKTRVEIATDKKFKHIVKKYTLSPKYLNSNKPIYIKNLKKAGFKKDKTYYVRCYTYRKVNGITIKSQEYNWEKFKITKKWEVKNSNKNSWWGWTEFQNNTDIDTILKAFGIDGFGFDKDLFDALYKK